MAPKPKKKSNGGIGKALAGIFFTQEDGRESRKILPFPSGEKICKVLTDL